MAETLLDVRSLPKRRAYEELEAQAVAVLESLTDEIAAMATISSLLHNGLGFLWTGFYRLVTPTLLRIGPYQGTLGCLEIPLGTGVCGSAAAQRRTIIVLDVASFAGHVTCDARSRSEIVVPVFAMDRSLLAVLDVDSAERAAFDDEDRNGLERLVRWFAEH
jgi:GAF domain-containing protein